MNRYDATGHEAEEQPGAEPGVLSNLPGLTSLQDITEAETELLNDLYAYVLPKLWDTLTFADIQRWHHQWLGHLYQWAGQLRTVNMSKGDFHFAAADQLPRLVSTFERDFLTQLSNLETMPEEAVIRYLAQSHVEFILIHPFREGNGRVSRLLLNVMALQAGFQPLDYQLWEENKEFYFRAIQAGVSGDYQHVERLVRDSLT
ncbi:Fic/DOC family protein [Oceanimonas sp. CAM02]|uniref:Fic/DOC family protein n=1 Tax=Oceanimonas sp. CAM02 TaxID=3080336 RepID=UPI0029361365|nr:Fic family protein [Oceanimonas sp. CAM02]MDV2857643.1 Fic family protein [Oceanimonas sp. CAM02]